MIHSPTISPSDPRWVVELKQWMASVATTINRLEGRGDGTTTIVRGGIVTAVPQWVPIKLQGSAGPDANGYYPCEVYGAGTDALPTAAVYTALAELVNMDVDTADTQGFLLARPVQRDIGGTLTQVWQVIEGIPPDPTGPGVFFLMVVGGQRKWVQGQDCDA